MKHILIIVFFLLSVKSIFAQDIKSEILGRWELIEYLDSTNTKMRSANHDLLLNQDSTFEINSESITVKGTWVLDDSKIILKGKNVKTGKDQIQKLSITLMTSDYLEFKVENIEFGFIKMRYKRKK